MIVIIIMMMMIMIMMMIMLLQMIMIMLLHCLHIEVYCIFWVNNIAVLISVGALLKVHSTLAFLWSANKMKG